MIQRRQATGIAGCILVAAVAFAASSAAQIYKWVDEKGGVHFTNDPPPKAPIEVIPETRHRSAVRDEPPSPREPEAESSQDDAPRAVRRRPAPADEEVEAVEVIEEESDVIIVDDGRYDPATRYRANSPRNRPGQPIRQPNRQPARQQRRAR